MENEAETPSEIKDNSGKIDFTRGIAGFITKTVIIAAAIVISLSYLTPDLSKLPRIKNSERNNLILLSFIQNPYVLWKLSILEEKKGKRDSAAKYMEAAIGLLEMHGATDLTIKKYQDRLDTLHSK
jgi:hypothetical protein